MSGLTEAEREALDEALWGGRIYDDVPEAVDRILADRLAAERARAERAEARVERVRGLADGAGNRFVRVNDVRAALDETAEGPSEALSADLRAEQAESGDLGDRDSAGLREAEKMPRKVWEALNLATDPALCDCGHGGLARSWHMDDCEARQGASEEGL